MHKKNKLKNKAGITLVALVITIIVLLILAGVTLNLTLGENGLLRRAEESKNAYLAGEKNDIEFLNSVYEYMNPYFGENEESNFLEVVHKIERVEVEIPVPEGGERYTDEKGAKIPIPQGFKYKEGTEETGLVITDALNENEFVWVPVKYVIEENGKIEETTKDIITIQAKNEKTQIKSIENITTDNIRKIEEGKYEVTENGEYVFRITNKADKSMEYIVRIEDIVATGNKAMARLQWNSDENYVGVLHDIFGTKYSREPDVLPDSNQWDSKIEHLTTINNILGTNYTTADQLGTALQTDYNEMVQSVDKYKGFFIGRYETSLDENKKAKSKVGVIPATAEVSSGNMWYGLYAYEKKRAEDNNYTSVKSHMIWGSNYDAMLMWAATGADAIKLTELGNAAHDLEKIYETGKVTVEGKIDRINNIYDLEGNGYEWTAEANDNCFRTCRGGRYKSKLYAHRNRTPAYPYYTYDCYCSRSALYIK